MGECRVYRGMVEVSTSKRFEVVDVTGLVEGIVSGSGVEEGIAHVYSLHTTAGVALNEAEPGLLEDITDYLADLTKPGHPWRHNRVDDNAHAHLSQVTVGASVTVPVGGGQLLLGTWQRILLVEMDGPRDRRLVVTVVGSNKG